MKEELVPYNVADLLKEKSFDWETEYQYNHYREHHKNIKGFLAAPTLSIAAKWLREKHGYYPLIIPTVTSSWTFKRIRVMSEADFKDGNVIEVEQPPYKGVDASDYSTYEQALSAGIKEALKLIS